MNFTRQVEENHIRIVHGMLGIYSYYLLIGSNNLNVAARAAQQDHNVRFLNAVE